MKKNSVKKTANLFASGVLILTIANLIVKVIGVMLKVPLSPLLGNEGMGYYNGAYEVYVWLYMISTAGLPVAIAMMVSESKSKGNFREVRKIAKISLRVFALIGLVCTAALILFSGVFADIIPGFDKLSIADSLYNLPGLEYGLCAIAPTLFFICISCAIRGYFQGYQYMTPTAISEVIESLGKLVIGILLANFALDRFADSSEKSSIAAAFTILGLTLGVALSLIYLIIKRIRFKEELYNAEFVRPDSDTMPVRSTKKLLKSLIVIAIPVTISASVMSFTTMLDSMIISNRLQGLGYSVEDVAGTIGYFKTQVITFFNLPPVLIYPISGSLVPYLSSLLVGKDTIKIKALMNSALRVASLIALPCALGMSVLSGPIIKLLFSSTYEPKAAELLSIQAIAIVCVAMLAMTTSILQAHKREKLPVISMFAGAAVKITTSYILIGNENIQILGAPISTVLCYITIVVLNFYFVARYVKFVPDFIGVFIRPLIASAITAGAAFGSYHLVGTVISSEKIATVLAICVAAVVYLFAIFLFRAITKDDFAIIPKGDALYRKLVKLRLMK